VPSSLSRTVRSVRTLALAGALAAGGLLASPAPSEAGAVLGMTQTGADISFDDAPPLGVTCTQTGPGDATSVGTFAADGVPVTKTVSSSATIKDNANAADTTSLSATAAQTVTATAAGGQLSQVHFGTTASASVTTAIAATKCHADVEAGGATMFQFDLPADTLVTVRGSSHHMVGIFQAGNFISPSDDIQAVISYTAGSSGSSSAVLKAGTGFISISQSFLDLAAAATAGTVSRAGDVSFDVTFQAPGVATATQFGSGAKYVKLSAGRGCPTGTVDLTWTKKAGKGDHRTVKKATVLVNGAKVKSVKKPKKKQVTHLTGIDPTGNARVQVVLKVKDKGELYTDRSYVQCT
jgi:hypothetical protein